ncbi:hypothetical protein [Aurantimonas sp.]|uniref:hypothetical protein n=1 Tax=Aurantimonas sp. TaxID=1872654 RepID=UPI0035120090
MTKKTRTARTAGLLRGLQTRNADAAILLRTLKNLKKTIAGNEVGGVYTELYESPLYKHLGLPDDFPRKPPTYARFYRIDDRDMGVELAIAKNRIERSQQKLSEAFVAIREINDSMTRSQWGNASDLVDGFRAEYGESLIILSKASLISRFTKAEKVPGNIHALLRQYGVLSRNISALAINDTIGAEYEYDSLRENTIAYYGVNKYFPPREADERYGYDLVRTTMYPYSWDPERFTSSLNSLLNSSLIDTAVYLMSHVSSPVLREALSIDASTLSDIPSELLSTWEELSGAPMPKFKYDDEEWFQQFYEYRIGVAFKELNEFRDFRLAVDPYVRDPSDTYLVVPPVIYDNANKYFVNEAGLPNLQEIARRTASQFTDYNAKDVGVTIMTAAFIRVLRQTDVLSSLSEEDLLAILNATYSVSDFSTSDELRRLSEANTDSLLYKYIVAALVFDQTSRNIDRTKLINCLQDVVFERCDGDLIAFARLLARAGAHIARHFHGLCTDEFLGLLFRLYATASEVSEARAAIQEWFADEFDEPRARERARSIRLNRRLQIRRGQINETRIFVDTLRFNQWVEENLYSQLAAGFGAFDGADQQLETGLNLGNFAERRTPTGLLASSLEDAFTEFCGNAQYGVDSYLGRRIRHGTLIGTMSGPLFAVLRSDDARVYRENPVIKEAVDHWISQFETKVRFLAANELQIRSPQKPKGLIHASLLDPEKKDVVYSALRRMVALYLDHRSIALASALMTDGCWQLLEVDLRRIRQKLSDHRTSWGRITALDLPVSSPNVTQREVQTLISVLNQTVDQQFAILTSWFHRPRSTANTAKLSELFDVTFAEAEEHNPSFKPKVVKEGLEEIEIIGGAYHHLYDLISPIVTNASRHGKPDGEIRIRMQLRQITENEQRIEVEITSELKEGDTEASVSAEIERTLSNAPVNAFIEEGKSGLRKLKQMEAQLREVQSVGIRMNDGRLSVSFEFNLFLREVSEC